MKQLLLPFCLVALAASAQQTIHSISNGAATNPFIWDCTCFPSTNDIIIIDHQVTMDVDWAITGGGRIEVSNGASLNQDLDRQLLVDGAGSQLIINGTAAFTDIAFTNGASGDNTGQFSVDRGLYFAAGTTFTNSSSINGIDSLLTEGTFTNSGTFYAGNFLNTGNFTNTGQIGCDSMGNTGLFDANGGYLSVVAFGNTGTFTMANQGFMNVSSNWYNGGDYTIATGLQVFVGGNAYTGDTLGGTANLVINGAMAVTSDFANSDNISGSGDLCVGNDSYNAGAVTGTIDFCDNTGGGFDLNVGSIAGTVTICTSGCGLGINENETTFTLFPNPATTVLHVESNISFEKAHFYSLTGELVQTIPVSSNSIELNTLKSGVYFVQLVEVTNRVFVRVVIQ